MFGSATEKRALGGVARRVTLAAAASLAALSAPGVVHAQEQSDAPQRSAGQSDGLDEIVVTAQRRVESLQTTPIAATVLDADGLNAKAVTSLADLQNAAPALSITTNGLVASANIRGIGLASGSPQVVPGAATYRDGLWQPPVTTTSTFFDIGSVEVLRGPQGTFVGNNSTGGAILINSRNPELEGVSGYVEAMGGSYNHLGANGAVNLPINDTMAMRIAFNGERRDSFYEHVGSNFNEPGRLDEFDVRLGFLWQPDDSLQFLFKSEIGNRSTDGYVAKPVPGVSPFASAQPSDPFRINYNVATLNEDSTVRNSLEVTWQPSPNGVTFRSLTGAQYFEIKNINDNDASPIDGGMTDQFVLERGYSQEFNILSPDDGRLTWLLGMYYLRDTRKVILHIVNPPPGPLVVPHLFTIIEDQAVFGQVGYEIAPGLEIEFGLRYTHDQLETTPGSAVDLIFAPDSVVTFPSDGEHSDNATTGKIAVNWTPNDDHFLYAFVARGFKSGGFDGGGVQFDPETVLDYEIGWKSYFFDRHLRMQLGAFWNDYEGFQFNDIGLETGQNAVTNIGEATVNGVEAQVEVQVGGWRIDASAAYVNSEFGSATMIDQRLLPPNINLPQCGLPSSPPAPGCFDYTPFAVDVNGSQNPFSPEITYNIGVEYAIDVGGNATLTPRVNFSHADEQWVSLIQNTPTSLLPAYDLWNASLTYNTPNWRAQAFVTNAADEVYIVGGGGQTQFYGAPRQYGVRISRTF